MKIVTLKKMALLAVMVIFSFSSALAEQARKEKIFNVTTETQTLLLKDLFAKVTVKKGNDKKVVVVISGEKSIENIAVKQDGPVNISIIGEKGDNDGVTNTSVISTGNSRSVVVISGGSADVI